MAKKRNGGRGKREGVGTRLCRLFEFPESCVPAVPYMELQGDMSLALTGYESLLVYDETNILFRMKPGAGGCCTETRCFPASGEDFTLLRITGQGLTICVLREGCLSVRGRISAVILHGDCDGGSGSGCGNG